MTGWHSVRALSPWAGTNVALCTRTSSVGPDRRPGDLRPVAGLAAPAPIHSPALDFRFRSGTGHSPARSGPPLLQIQLAATDRPITPKSGRTIISLVDA